MATAPVESPAVRWVQGVQLRGHDIIAIGGSAGGLPALKELLQRLPSLPVSLFAVLHTSSSHRSELAQSLTQGGRYRAQIAEDGALIEPGRLMLAPSAKHLVVEHDRVRLSDGPRENFWRPSIDVLLRSAAVAHRGHVTGVILSGLLDDGVARPAARFADRGQPRPRYRRARDAR